MILCDTDILSAMAKVGQLDLLYPLLLADTLHIVPAVLRELEVAHRHQRPFTRVLFDLIETHRIMVVTITSAESAFAESLPNTLGERETMAVTHHRRGILLSNESRVAYWCREADISYLNLPMVLRALWRESLVTQGTVRQLIADLKTQDNMAFSTKAIADIFAP